MKTKTLVVCSQANWVAQDFLDATIEDLDVIADKGFDLPKIAPSSDVAWWMPTEHAVKLRYSGFSLPFISTGVDWLSNLPETLTRRKITTVSVADLRLSPYDGERWIKPAEFKHQEFFAGMYSADAVATFNLPQGAMLQYTDTILDIESEYRFYVVDGQVVTGSLYLSNSVTYYDGAVSSRYDEALAFAYYAVRVLGDNQPPAYTLDVAYDSSLEDWLILEGNPMFSSAIYGADPALVAESLLRCVNPCEGDEKWLWIPDDYLLKKYANMRPLR